MLFVWVAHHRTANGGISKKRKKRVAHTLIEILRTEKAEPMWTLFSPASCRFVARLLFHLPSQEKNNKTTRWTTMSNDCSQLIHQARTETRQHQECNRLFLRPFCTLADHLYWTHVHPIRFFFKLMRCGCFVFQFGFRVLIDRTRYLNFNRFKVAKRDWSAVKPALLF